MHYSQPRRASPRSTSTWLRRPPRSPEASRRRRGGGTAAPARRARSDGAPRRRRLCSGGARARAQPGVQRVRWPWERGRALRAGRARERAGGAAADAPRVRVGRTANGPTAAAPVGVAVEIVALPLTRSAASDTCDGYAHWPPAGATTIGVKKEPAGCTTIGVKKEPAGCTTIGVDVNVCGPRVQRATNGGKGGPGVCPRRCVPRARASSCSRRSPARLRVRSSARLRQRARWARRC